jgi:hypothetical protein
MISLHPFEEYTVDSKRNKISLYLNSKVNLCTNNLILIIQYLKNNLPFNPYLTIQLTNMDDLAVDIKCKDYNDSNIDNILKILFHAIHLTINGTVYKTERLREYYFNHQIFRSPASFHQCDENIRTILYQEIQKLFNKNYDNFIFIGGEMYIYGKLVNCPSIFYSDFQSLVDDTKYNILNSKSFCVNYNDMILENNIAINNIAINNIAINGGIMINTSKGLTSNLLKEILKCKIKYIYCIGCKYKYILNDCNLLLNYYTLNKFIKFTSTYTVYLYCFTLNT